MDRLGELGEKLAEVVKIQRDAYKNLVGDLTPGSMTSLTKYIQEQNKFLESFDIKMQKSDFSAFAKAIVPNADLFLNIQEIGLSSKKQRSFVADMVKPLIDPAFINKFQTSIEESNKRTIQHRDYFLQHSFFLSPFLANSIYDSQIDHLINSRGNPWDFAESIFSDSSSIRKLKEYWAQNVLYQSRMHILEKAIDAHCNHDYLVSIPLFLIHMDGLIIDIYPGLKKMSQRERMLKTAKPEEESGVLKAHQEILGETFIADIICDQMLDTWFPGDSLKNDTFPNRHQILHGGDLNYHKRKHYSLKCLLVLDGLSVINLLVKNRLESKPN